MTYKLDNGLYVHRKYFENLTGDTGQVGMFWILAKSRPDVAKVTAEIERRFDNAPVPIRAMSEKQWQLMFMEMLGNVQAAPRRNRPRDGVHALPHHEQHARDVRARAARRGGAAEDPRIPPADRAAAARPRGRVLRGRGGGPRGGLHGALRAHRSRGLSSTRSGPGSARSSARTPSIVLVVGGLSLLVAVLSSLVPAINLSGRPVVSLAREAA